MVGVFRIILDNRNHRGGIDESRQIVNVAVRVIPGDSIFQPENVRYSKIVLEDFCIVFAREPWIALLRLAEKTFLCGEQRASTVYVDAPPFEHAAPPFVHWFPH